MTVRKRLCRNCIHCKGRQVRPGAITSIFWCEIAKFGVLPWLDKPHPKCPVKRKGVEKP